MSKFKLVNIQKEPEEVIAEFNTYGAARDAKRLNQGSVYINDMVIEEDGIEYGLNGEPA